MRTTCLLLLPLAALGCVAFMDVGGESSGSAAPTASAGATSSTGGSGNHSGSGGVPASGGLTASAGAAGNAGVNQVSSGGSAGSVGPPSTPLAPYSCDSNEPDAANAYFVAPGGNDGGPGTKEQPFASIGKAVSKLGTGITVYVRAGTYSETVWLGANGSAAALATLKAYRCEKAVIDGSALSVEGALVSFGGQYLRLVGFEIKNSNAGGVSVWGGTNVEIIGNVIHDVATNGIWTGNGAHDIVIQANELYRTTLSNQNRDKQGGWANAVGAGVPNVVVSGNTIHENYGEGIVVAGPGPVEVTGNVLWDNFSAQIYLEKAHSVSVTRNYLRHTGGTGFDWGPGFPAQGHGNGIVIAHENENGGGDPGGDALIANNVITGVGIALYYGNFQQGGGLRNTLIAHNTVYAPSIEALHIDSDPGHYGSRIVDNVFVDTNGGAFVYVGGTNGLTFGHNLFAGGSASSAAGSGDVFADPEFVAPGGASADGYHLSAGSPALGAAMELGEVNDDFDGVQRGNPADLGAFED